MRVIKPYVLGQHGVIVIMHLSSHTHLTPKLSGPPKPSGGIVHNITSDKTRHKHGLESLPIRYKTLNLFVWREDFLQEIAEETKEE